jgi:hypothetical protein
LRRVTWPIKSIMCNKIIKNGGKFLKVACLTWLESNCMKLCLFVQHTPQFAEQFKMHFNSTIFVRNTFIKVSKPQWFIIKTKVIYKPKWFINHIDVRILGFLVNILLNFFGLYIHSYETTIIAHCCLETIRLSLFIIVSQ